VSISSVALKNRDVQDFSIGEIGVGGDCAEHVLRAVQKLFGTSGELELSRKCGAGYYPDSL
jgi:hypothetical protein